MLLFVFTGVSVAKPADTLYQSQQADLSIRFLQTERRLSIDGLAAAWTMDEGSGYTFNDLTGNGHTAYITGYHWNTQGSGLPAAFRSAGRRAGGVYLDAQSWLQVQASKNLEEGMEQTIAFWMKPDTIQNRSQMLFATGNEQHYYHIALAGNQLNFTFSDTKKKRTEFGYTIPAGVRQWMHIAFTIHKENGQIELFINGDYKKSFTGRLNDFVFPKGHEVYIGAAPLTDSSSGFRGWLDEFCWFQKKVSASAILQLYREGLPAAYAQAAATIDNNREVWSSFKGNQLIPHVREEDTRLLLRFNGDFRSETGTVPVNSPKDGQFIAGVFGAAWLPGRQMLQYETGLDKDEGTVELWLHNIHSTGSPKGQLLFSLSQQKKNTLSLQLQNGQLTAIVNQNGKRNRFTTNFAVNTTVSLTHVAISWKDANCTVWLNGSIAGSFLLPAPFRADLLSLGGDFSGGIDDLKLSSSAKEWGAVCPTGYTDSESAMLDFTDDFNGVKPDEPLYHWRSVHPNAKWNYHQHIVSGKQENYLMQTNHSGWAALLHPAALGYTSSIESGLLFSTIRNGWAGVFTHGGLAPEFSGITFSMNPFLNKIRLARYQKGIVVEERLAPYDFKIAVDHRYTLTLSVYENQVHGHIDGNSVIAMPLSEHPGMGYGGLFTDQISAGFDDVHFTALTPANHDSRLLKARVITGGDSDKSELISYKLSYSAFKWQKRHGLLPWQRTYKLPEAPGNIFGPMEDGVPRPNGIAAWRTEDNANADIIMVNGTMFLSMRGNPDYNGPHGNAAIGMLVADQERFDGIHFKDLNADSLGNRKIGLFRGHSVPDQPCNDQPPRNTRLQINDQGMIYTGGRILVMAREFRNHVDGYPKFKRLTYNLFDVGKQSWSSADPLLVNWSYMSSDDCTGEHRGLDATPELCLLKDPHTGMDQIYLYHSSYHSLVTGLRLDNGKLLLDTTGYPTKKMFEKTDGDRVYGQRIFFDNGIYYMHVNAGTDKSKLKQDWPDRFHLLVADHPYNSNWVESSDNRLKERPYFGRGNENDPDNAAIWQGTLFKYRNQYMMYYENYHSVKNINQPYDRYDDVHSGSRLGFATAN